MINIDDYDAGGGRLTIRRLKGSRGGDHHLTETERSALNAWLQKRGIGPGPLFPSRSGRGISRSRLHRLMRKYCVLAGIDHGKAVAKVLDSPAPSEVFVFGAVFIRAQPSAYVQLAGDLDRLKSLPNYLVIQRFSNPPELSNLNGFEIDADDVDTLFPGSVLTTRWCIAPVDVLQRSEVGPKGVRGPGCVYENEE